MTSAHIIAAYKANLAAHPGIGAKSALRWAKDEAARKAFFDQFSEINHNIERHTGIDPSDYFRGDYELFCYLNADQSVALLCCRNADHDGGWLDENAPETSQEHHCARAFFSGASDFISAKESQSFGRRDVSYNLRADYEDLLAWHRKGNSRGVADVLARAAIFRRLESLASDEGAFWTYGFLGFHRNAAGDFEAHAPDDIEWLSGCDSDDERATLWEMGLAAEYRHACELAAGAQAVRAFAGL